MPRLGLLANHGRHGWPFWRIIYLYVVLFVYKYIYIYRRPIFFTAWIVKCILGGEEVSAQRLRICPRDPQVVAPGEGRRPSCRSAEGPNAAPGATVNELRQPEAARTFTSATSFDRLERRRARRNEEAIRARNQKAQQFHSIFWF